MSLVDRSKRMAEMGYTHPKIIMCVEKGMKLSSQSHVAITSRNPFLAHLTKPAVDPVDTAVDIGLCAEANSVVNPDAGDMPSSSRC